MSTRYQKNSFMRKAGNTKKRPEQMLIAEVIEHHATQPIKVLTEEKIVYITESHQEKWAEIDVYVVWKSPADEKPGEYLLRVQGAYHDEPTQRKKDDLQRSYLMALHPPLRNIVTVCDLWYHLMPTTFQRNKRMLNRSEAIISYNEIVKQTHNIFHMPEKPKESWLISSRHIIAFP